MPTAAYVLRTGGDEAKPSDADREGPTAGAPMPASPASAVSRRTVALRLAASQGAVTRSQLAQACRVSGEAARRELAALVTAGQLRRIGARRGTRYVVP